ncbi:peptidylprolyl isomerase [Desulfosporosinus sp. SB140]|uniref:peptidylprolyl isomerase n=1 Tax=Desulfosporosinus paludis TaxID=3115649 RepID=UPI00388FF172
MKKVRRMTMLLLGLMVILATLGCGAQTNNSASQGSNKTSQGTTPTPTPTQTPTTTNKSNPIVTITMANGDQIKAELYPTVAPNTVKNFISLVKKGFYNGLTFHRVIPGFMIQGGDPSGNGSGGPGYSIKGEFTNNGFKNDLKHERGVLSMARTQEPNSAGSQFFIMVASAASLDGDYAAFGKVTSGMDAVDKIVNTPRDQADKPLQNQVMKSVTVDTFGVDYGDPEIIKQ